METRSLGRQGLTVSAQGLGCMGMSEFYAGRDEAESVATIHRALDLGLTFLDTADMYGPYTNEELVGRRDDRPLLPAPRRQDGPDRGDGGGDGRSRPRGEGQVLGLSEASPATIRRAHAIHPISALQSEYSLWTRDPEDGILPACRELGIGFVPYSPLGRGFLTGRFRRFEDLPEGDYRRGTKSRPRLEENIGALAVTLSAGDLARIDAVVPKGVAAGPRYPEMAMKAIDG